MSYLLCSLLRRNALHCQPIQWQRENLPFPGPSCPWVATYICPILPEALGRTLRDNSASMEDLVARNAARKKQPEPATPPRSATATAASAGTTTRSSSGAGPAAGGSYVQSTGSAAPVLCAACSRPPSVGLPLLRCGRCKAVWYCCAECQKSHWGRHKAVCNK